MTDSAHGGADWKARSKLLPQEIGLLWADIGATSECGVLKKVLLHRPGKGIENINNASKVLWKDIIKPEKAREQHDNLAEIYRSLGVDVQYLDAYGNDTPNLFFLRDLFIMTSQGAIISRPAGIVRIGEEVTITKNLAKLGVPILLTVHSSGIFEGPDVVIVNESLAFVGTGIRSNQEGASQVSTVLNSLGIETILVQTTYGCGHLDGVMNIIDYRKVILFPTRVSYIIYETLKNRGFTIIDLPNIKEAEEGMAINVVPIAPGIVVMPSGNKITRKLLEKHKVKCHEVDVSELMKGGGAIHCMTGILKREKM